MIKQKKDLLGNWRLSIFATACAFAITATAFGQSSNKDVIWLRDRAGTTSGKIQSVSPDQVTIIASGGPQNIPMEIISKLRLSDDPTGMTSVRAAVQSGQFEQASNQLKSVESVGRSVTLQDVEYHRVLVASRLALQGGGINDAAKQVAAFIKSNANSFRYYAACELMGDLAMGLGRFDSAANYYGKISRANSISLSAKGKHLQANAWLRRGDFAEAASLFREAAAATDSRLRNMASIGLALCMVEEGKPDEAVQRIEKIIEENESTDVELFARAYNALGMAYAMAGNKESALDAYLHTDLLFYRDHDAHAEALYHLVKLWSAVNKPTESKKAKQTLQTGYAASLWAKK